MPSSILKSSLIVVEAPMLNRFIHTAVSVSVSAALVCAPMSAYPMTMQDMFNGMGNTTPAGAYQGQTQNVYTGGSMAIRMPQKTYQISSFTPPSIRGGCGGIDIFGGAFSHINAQEFVNMLQNIGSAALSQAFFMAIDAMSPMVGVNLKQLMDKLQKATNQSINSCEQGKALLAQIDMEGKMGGLKKWSVDHSVDHLFSNNTFPDRAEAENKTKNDAPTQVAALTVKVVNENHIIGNLVWNVLALNNKSGGEQVSEFEARLLMSLVGSEVIGLSSTEAASSGTTAKPAPIPAMASAQTLKNFIGVSDKTGLDGFQIYQCFNADAAGNRTTTVPTALDGNNVFANGKAQQCAYFTPVPVGSPEGGGASWRSFLQLVTDKMTSINLKLRDDKVSLSPDEIQFINRTTLPVYKMLAVSNALKRSGLGDVMIENNKAMIAAEYANAYINSLFETLGKALANASNKTGAYSDTIKKIEANMYTVRQLLNEEMLVAHANSANMHALGEQVAQMERMMMSNLPNNLSGAYSLRRQ